MKAIILIKMNAGDLRGALRDLKRLRSVDEAHLTFGPYDAIVILQADNLSVLGRIVAREIQLIPGVVETCTCLMVDADALEGIQAADYPAGETQPEGYERPVRRGIKTPFGVN